MISEEIFTLLKTLNIPIAYRKFSKAVKPPFAVFFNTQKAVTGSDDKNFVCNESFRIELYTKTENSQEEKAIERLLDFVEFDSETIYVESENLCLTAFDFSIIHKI